MRFIDITDNLLFQWSIHLLNVYMFYTLHTLVVTALRLQRKWIMKMSLLLRVGVDGDSYSNCWESKLPVRLFSVLFGLVAKTGTGTQKFKIRIQKYTQNVFVDFFSIDN